MIRNEKVDTYYLGSDKSGTIRKTLIEPTNLLLERVDSIDAKGGFYGICEYKNRKC